MCPRGLAGGLPSPPPLRPFRPLAAPDTAQVWGPRTSMHWDGLMDLIYRAQKGPPEASWPRPSTRGLYTVALTCPSGPGTHRGFASANKSDSGAADSWTGPPGPVGHGRPLELQSRPSHPGVRLSQQKRQTSC